MKRFYFKSSFALFLAFAPIMLMAQAPLQYQLNQQGSANCTGSPVELSVTTSVRLTTAEATEVAISSAVSGGNIANDGGNTVTQRGVCWNTSSNPTTANFSTSDGAGLGNFISNLSDLNSNTTYYVRAYAISISGTFYGNEVSFTTGNEANPTPHSCGAENVHNPNFNYGSMTDQDGNIYKTIVIDNQEWMAENLKVSHYRNGDLIPNIADNTEWGIGITSGYTTGAYCWYNNDSASYDCPYGKLYNYFAVADSRNLCPSGWHVPTDVEWNELLVFLDPTYGPFETPGYQTGIGGGIMQSIGTYYWQNPNQLATNVSGFSGLPGGGRIGTADFLGLGTTGLWWSSTLIDVENAWGVYLNNINYVGSGPYRNRSGSSVRCLKGESVIQGSINTLDCESASSSGNFIQGTATNDLTTTVPYTGGNGGTYPAQTITSTGVTGLTATSAAGTFANGAGTLIYTISGTPENVGIASFALNIGGQSCSLQIPVYAPQIGTPHSCGAENVHNPNLNYGTMTDQDGNIYKTIVIGNQEWMAENLKVSHYRNGDLIPNITSNSEWEGLLTGASCWYDSDSASYDCPYGKLYNWYAVSDARNVCAAGWHVPSDTEWSILINYIDPIADYGNNPYPNIAGGKMKSTGMSFWDVPNQNATNESGFSALPGGARISDFGGFLAAGQSGLWWSSSQSPEPDKFWGLILTSYDSSTIRYDERKQSGLSIRCLKDSSPQQGSINNFDCGSATNNGTLTSGTAASGVSSTVPYTGGNGGTHNGQTVNSTGVSGLTASLESGTFANGVGSLTYTITGTPNASGTASFALNIGGQTCTLQIPVISNQPVSTHSCGAENVHNPNLSYGSMTDQDGNIYKTIVIDNQEWMAENLKASHYRNGDLIPIITDNALWGGLSTGAACWNNNDSITYDCPYGKLYNYYAVADSRNVCPTGWHIPNDAGWSFIINYLDPNADGGNNDNIASGKMRSTGTQYWFDTNQDATNETGFSALPGGSRTDNGTFSNAFNYGTVYWSSTEYYEGAWARDFYQANGRAYRNAYVKRYGLSVRCLKDSSPQQGSINSIDCGSSLTSGILTQGSAAGDLTSSVPYTGGNGGTYPAQTITSTGVTGLTATSAAGTFANGVGALTYVISGTPESSGAASFALNIGGQSCTLQIPVNAPQIGTPHSCGAENVHNPAKTYSSMTDQDGNVYKTIIIGNQEWMAENLKASHYRNGDLIPNITDNATWVGLTTGATCWNNNDSVAYDCPYGKLYNFYAVADFRNVCPTGWHVPSDAEWSTLINFIDPLAGGGNTFPNIAGGKMKSAGTQYSISPNVSATNESGFSALAAGNRTNYDGASGSVGDSFYWWSSSELMPAAAWVYYLISGEGYAFRSGIDKRFGFSVRCLKDSLPQPQTGTPNSCGAENVHNPNLNYGNMTDQDGNIYKTIVIGDQEWMAENLKTSIYRNGDPIPNVSDAVQWTGLSTGAWCFYNNESQNDCPFGKLYNWYTVADPRNVCPVGWHVPTDSEWNTLIGFLDPAYNPNAPINYQSFLAGGKLKSTGLGYWYTPNLDATNESGFSGMPGGGSLGNGDFYSIGQGGIWWSSSENIDVTVAAWYRAINKNNANVQRSSAGKRCGSSVRCLKD
jgi:uncharacterized protein (TIGR02145 family)